MNNNSLAKYYQKIKKDYKKGSWEISKSSQRRKWKKWEHGCKRYKNFPEDYKQRLVELGKIIFKNWKNTSR